MELIQMPITVPGAEAGTGKEEAPAQLVCYLQQPQNVPAPRPAVIICPGGGYCYTSPREGEPVALQYLAAGMQAFVLYYSCAPAVFPQALLELATAVSVVRAHAAEWNIDPHRVFVGGFSAGGHLAASLGCFWNREFVYGPLGLQPQQIRPDGNLLCYPVITSGEYAHRGSFDALCAGLDPERYLPLTSLELQAGEQNPPTFLWHTQEDGAVPVENSLMYWGALHRSGVSAELHIYPHGGHGLSLATAETGGPAGEPVPKVQSWLKLSVVWMNGFKREE